MRTHEASHRYNPVAALRVFVLYAQSVTVYSLGAFAQSCLCMCLYSNACMLLNAAQCKCSHVVLYARVLVQERGHSSQAVLYHKESHQPK